MALIRTADVPEYYFEERCFIKELFNQPDLPGLSIARARVESGVTTVLHQLTGTEVYYILAGTGEAEIGERRFVVGPGDVLRIDPHQPQRITNTGSVDLLFLAICTPRFKVANYSVVG